MGDLPRRAGRWLNLGSITETLNRGGAQTVMVQKYSARDRRRRQAHPRHRRVPVPYCLARIPQGSEIRGNLAAGAGRGAAAHAAATARSRRRSARCSQHAACSSSAWTMIGDALTEINVTSPTRFQEIMQQTGATSPGCSSTHRKPRRGRCSIGGIAPRPRDARRRTWTPGETQDECRQPGRAGSGKIGRSGSTTKRASARRSRPSASRSATSPCRWASCPRSAPFIGSVEAVQVDKLEVLAATKADDQLLVGLLKALVLARSSTTTSTSSSRRSCST